MKIKIAIKSWYTGKVLFEYESENNTLYMTLKEALKAGANLYGANLRDANLYDADLRGANLYGADLYGANLRDANLYDADLRGADLRGANLRGANLRGANLYGADLYGANLYGANLRGANLYGADLYGANLYGANLRDAKNAELPQAYTVIVPDGSIIGWKKCRDSKLVKLLIPEEARRSNGTGRKCRAEFANVLEIIDLKDKRKKCIEAISQHDSKFKYKVGERVTCDEWIEDRFEECAGGIHFFITRIEAENY